MDHWDRTTPITLARNTPIAQAEIDFPCCDGAATAHFFFKPLGDFFARFLRGHAIKKTRIDHPAIIDIGGVGDHKGLRVLAFRADNRNIAETIHVHKIKVALIMRRAAENGACAIIHQNEIRDIDRQSPAWIKRMNGANAGIKSTLFGLFDFFLRRAHAFAFGDKISKAGIIFRRSFCERMVRRERKKLRTK